MTNHHISFRIPSISRRLRGFLWYCGMMQQPIPVWAMPAIFPLLYGDGE